MVIRQLKPRQFEYLHESLIKKAYTIPLDASYIVNMKINGEEHDVKVQPENNYKIAILQALQIHRDEDGPNFTLITRGNLLSSLLEILICRGIR